MSNHLQQLQLQLQASLVASSAQENRETDVLSALAASVSFFRAIPASLCSCVSVAT